jgi:hypothetical protein
MESHPAAGLQLQGRAYLFEAWATMNFPLSETVDLNARAAGANKWEAANPQAGEGMSLMLDFIAEIGVGSFIALVAIVGGLLIPLTAIIGGFIYKHRRLSVEASLKQLMIERGMSAEEITEVLQASTSEKARRNCSRANSPSESRRYRA